MADGARAGKLERAREKLRRFQAKQGSGADLSISRSSLHRLGSSDSLAESTTSDGRLWRRKAAAADASQSGPRPPSAAASLPALRRIRRLRSRRAEESLPARSRHFHQLRALLRRPNLSAPARKETMSPHPDRKRPRPSINRRRSPLTSAVYPPPRQMSSTSAPNLHPQRFPPSSAFRTATTLSSIPPMAPNLLPPKSPLRKHRCQDRQEPSTTEHRRSLPHLSVIATATLPTSMSTVCPPANLPPPPPPFQAPSNPSAPPHPPPAPARRSATTSGSGWSRNWQRPSSSRPLSPPS